MKIILFFFLLIFTSKCFTEEKNNPSELLLANIYRQGVLLKNYWVSEKLDGIRAYWNGTTLISRGGHVFNAPDWFLKPLPSNAMDGELWIGRGMFEQVASIVKLKTNVSSNWRHVKYMIFDFPDNTESFDRRLIKMQKMIEDIQSPHVQLIQQFRVLNHGELMLRLENIVNLGGEGLMLHEGDSIYKSGRSSDLLKLKKFSDAEAVVIQHLPGKGKYKFMLGAILVETPKKIRFKIGSGFSDEERKNPPPIGATITYKYTGLSKNGVPRFASYLRLRNEN